MAFSGGADSAVCAWAASRLRAPVRAVHIDHGWPASAALRHAACEVTDHLGIGLTVIETEPHAGPSPEGQARVARYRALENDLTPGEWLITGHTKDDQAETVLGNLLRGAGAAGLAGIPRRRERIVRPMLDITRTETRELAALLGLPWIDDPTNWDISLRRNALRREVIPDLEARFNPSLRAGLTRLASVLADDERFLNEAAESVPVQVVGSTVRLPASLLATIPTPVAARAVRRALREIYHGHPGSAAEVATVLSVAHGSPPAELAGSVRVERQGAWITLGRPDAPDPPSLDWSIPGAVTVGAWTLEGWLDDTPPAAFPLSPFVEVFDADAVPASLEVRSMQPGDGLVIGGGTKSLPEVMSEAHIPSARRSSWPLVVASGNVVWVPGVRRAGLGWVSTTTRRYLWVRATVEGHS